MEVLIIESGLLDVLNGGLVSILKGRVFGPDDALGLLLVLESLVVVLRRGVVMLHSGRIKWLSLLVMVHLVGEHVGVVVGVHLDAVGRYHHYGLVLVDMREVGVR
jgi:hypothetical protein